MKRLAMGLSGALLQPSDDDSTPLVADTPTTYVLQLVATNLFIIFLTLSLELQNLSSEFSLVNFGLNTS